MKIGGIIRGWYEKNKRDLPWRRTNDPYKIWLSEVILQQTRVNQGLTYYLDFIKAFPDIKSLAHASEDEVLKKWQGLGYYSRARNLHQAARELVEHLEGELPASYDGLLRLKGVGNYTASAIASICFREPRAVVDGNVSRVIARIFGVEEPINSGPGSKVIASLAGELLDKQDPGTHNQAIMEFGALQCVPALPDCSACPLPEYCEAYKTGRISQLPVKIPKRRPVERWMFFYILLCNEETVITKRGTDDIWKSLYQFPAVESDTPLNDQTVLESIHKKLKMESIENDKISLVNNQVTIRLFSDPIRHQLTHRTIRARFIHVEIPAWPQPLPSGWMKISLDQLTDFPVPQLINRYMEVAKI